MKKHNKNLKAKIVHYSSKLNFNPYFQSPNTNNPLNKNQQSQTNILKLQ